MSGRGLALGPGDQYLQEIDVKLISQATVGTANIITRLFGAVYSSNLG